MVWRVSVPPPWGSRRGLLFLALPCSKLREDLLDLEAWACLGRKLVMSVQRGLRVLAVQIGEERDDGGALCGGHGVGWDRTPHRL